MGLTSALSTALTGMNGAETTIDVVGNNLANSNTVGFKSSSVSFATQFLQTLSLGGAPTSDSGGTNPMQVGLGTTVAQITPDFSQGTVSNSSNPYDMAIQGDGFFIVQGGAGEVLYTRNGEFKLNSENELTTTTGNRVLGYGVDDNFQIQKTTLEPLSIPLGSAAVAQATQNAYLEGTLTPTGDVADTGSIIHTNILGRDDYDYPTTAVTTNNCDRPQLHQRRDDLHRQHDGGQSHDRRHRHLPRRLWSGPGHHGRWRCREQLGGIPDHGHRRPLLDRHCQHPSQSRHDRGRSLALPVRAHLSQGQSRRQLSLDR